MRIASLLREVARNVGSGTSQALTLFLVSALTGTLLVAADTFTVRGLIAEADAFRDRGAAIMTITAPGAVDGRSCASLRDAEGVLAAGAIRARNDDLRLSVLPSIPVSAYEVTTGFPTLLAPEPEAIPSGVLLASEVAEQIGVMPGDAISTQEGPVELAAVYAYPSDGRRGGLNWAVLAPVPQDGVFDECWASTWPPKDGLSTLLNATIVAGAPQDDGPQISQLNTTLGVHFNVPERYASRLTRYVPLVAVLGALALGWIAIRRRRLGIASDMHAGLTRSDAVTQMLLEASSWAIPAGAFCVSAAALFAAGLHVDELAAALTNALRVAVALTGGALLGTLLGTLAVRERHLFAYFKDRQ
ncbi:hypothetical protein [Agromyces archimandritae]|uniref:Uncharacterized protein n=1 Tax=Agromyces archimandritae TaxID=2781962 RepID=A0A975IP67_9MICO|nr:hypothetical protein [Agromyces archimandritae]QTX05333.1 hypothetical protein G127AT_03650 [Agromyces archimandritae]